MLNRVFIKDLLIKETKETKFLKRAKKETIQTIRDSLKTAIRAVETQLQVLLI